MSIFKGLQVGLIIKGLVLFGLLIITSCSYEITYNKSDKLDIMTTIDTNNIEYVMLPSLSSSSYTTEEAKNRIHEIYDMQLSVKHFNWENSSNAGGAIHINENDEIEIYQFPTGLMYTGRGVDTSGDSVVFVARAPKDTSIVVGKKDIRKQLNGYYTYGDDIGCVLITSEFDLKKSKSLDLILDEVFGRFQIYYLKRKE